MVNYVEHGRNWPVFQEEEMKTIVIKRSTQTVKVPSLIEVVWQNSPRGEPKLDRQWQQWQQQYVKRVTDPYKPFLFSTAICRLVIVSFKDSSSSTFSLSSSR